ncbi:MAG: hypothetical protein LBB78_09500, partial [Spirochaetaceae bacterium]|nr:hypothetical protein [Spirochaetaceae bacterium]
GGGGGGGGGQGTSITLTNIPDYIADMSDKVMVCLASGYDTYVEVGGLGTITSGSVTVELYTIDYRGSDDPEDMLGTSWTNDGRSYLIMYYWGPNYRFDATNSLLVPLTGNPIEIDASNFVIDGPDGPATGHIKGGLSIGIPTDITVTGIYMEAFEEGPNGEDTYLINLDPSKISGGYLNEEFDIPLYANRVLSGAVSLRVLFYFSDETEWVLIFNSTETGLINLSNTGTTTVSSTITDSIPQTKIVTGYGTIDISSIPGSTNKFVQIYTANWNYETRGDAPWTFRVPIDVTTANIRVYTFGLDDKLYNKANVMTWNDEPTFNLGTITLTTSDLFPTSP